MVSSKSRDYWSDFWFQYNSDIAGQDEQTQVLRTRNKVPIDVQKWELTLQTVAEHLEFSNTDTLLDLCCGNGLFSQAFHNFVDKLEAVDISAPLVDRLNARNLYNVHAEAKDIRDASFSENSFSKVLWYAGIQYIDEGDIIEMLRKIHKWMKPGGILMIGDIPDRSKLWGYFNDETRRSAYFRGLERREPILGTWLDTDWIENLCALIGFNSVNAVAQDSRLIYADFRFDVIAKV